MSTLQRTLSFIFVVSFVLFEFVDEVVSELCSSGIRCEKPDYCCGGTSCCSYERNDGYRYNYRVSFWNLWYFWFIILFVLMSCFGGCGYYKQRQRYTTSGSVGSTITQVSNYPRNPLRRRTLDRMPLPTAQTYIGGYSGPGAEEPIQTTMYPPPYSEVITHPGLYPENKVAPPPYPGYKHAGDSVDSELFSAATTQTLHTDDDSRLQNTVVIMPPQPCDVSSQPQPPPYSEHESSRSSEPTSQHP